jgi:succinate dehydrogenase flavin-adding protein (antitoxin of CptAB toxin-antitoxin module)
MKKHLAILFSIIFISSSCALLNPNPNRKEPIAELPLTLSPFTTDYCSEWPDGKSTDPKQWALCCFTHDLNYWVGGNEEQRKLADEELKTCVKQTSSNSLNSFLMYIGVRMGGSPGDASYAWGYGWNKDRKYFQLSEDDKKKARELLEISDNNKNVKEKKLIHAFIKKHLN